MPQIDDLKLRSASLEWWEATNPTPAEGEPCVVVPEGKKRGFLLKFGDGVTAFNSLPWFERESPAALALGDVYEIEGENVTQIDLTIPVDYESLVIVAHLHLDDTASNYLQLRFNGDTAASYDDQRVAGGNATVSAAANRAVTSMMVGSLAGETSGISQQIPGPVIIEIPLYRTAGVGFRTVISSCGQTYATGAADIQLTRHFGMWRNNGSITQVSLFPAGGKFSNGGQIICFGIRP